jgi:hypothetical protein
MNLLLDMRKEEMKQHLLVEMRALAREKETVLYRYSSMETSQRFSSETTSWDKMLTRRSMQRKMLCH